MTAYTDEQIKTAHILLNQLEIKGLENAKRIVMLQQILEQGRAIDDTDTDARTEA